VFCLFSYLIPGARVRACSDGVDVDLVVARPLAAVPGPLPCRRLRGRLVDAVRVAGALEVVVDQAARPVGHAEEPRVDAGLAELRAGALVEDPHDEPLVDLRLEGRRRDRAAAVVALVIRFVELVERHGECDDHEALEVDVALPLPLEQAANRTVAALPVLAEHLHPPVAKLPCDAADLQLAERRLLRRRQPRETLLLAQQDQLEHLVRRRRRGLGTEVRAALLLALEGLAALCVPLHRA